MVLVLPLQLPHLSSRVLPLPLPTFCISCTLPLPTFWIPCILLSGVNCIDTSYQVSGMNTFIESRMNQIQYLRWEIDISNSRGKVVVTGWSRINNLYFDIIDSRATSVNIWQLDHAIDTRDRWFPVSILNPVPFSLNNHVCLSFHLIQYWHWLSLHQCHYWIWSHPGSIFSFNFISPFSLLSLVCYSLNNPIQ